MTFRLGTEDGVTSHFMSGPLDRFEKWANRVAEKFPGEIDRRCSRLSEMCELAGRRHCRPQTPCVPNRSFASARRGGVSIQSEDGASSSGSAQGKPIRRSALSSAQRDLACGVSGYTASVWAEKR